MDIDNLEARFHSKEEEALGRSFLADGHLKFDVEERPPLDRIRSLAVKLAAEHLGIEPPSSPRRFLDNTHEQVSAEALNPLRLAVFRGMNARPWFRPACFHLARRALAALVGNELAMQRRINLSIQLPGDDSSLLPLHADSWSGDSPYEIVLWIPLVDCARTKSLFLLPPDAQERMMAQGVSVARSVEDLFKTIEPEIRFLEVPYGQALLFNQNLAHGNRINQESTTRWSLNCRFKGLFTPYAEKTLGEFFEPITLKPMSRIGMEHRFPGSFDDG